MHGDVIGRLDTSSTKHVHNDAPCHSPSYTTSPPSNTQENKIDYAMRERNPLDSVSFFDGLDSVQKRKLRPDQVPSMVVATFQEKCLRCYSRNSDPRYVAALHEAFAAWVARRFGGSVETSTPAKPPRTQWVQGEEQAGGKRGRALDYALPPAHANGERTAQRRRDL